MFDAEDFLDWILEQHSDLTAFTKRVLAILDCGLQKALTEGNGGNGEG